MRAHLVQFDIRWEDATANRDIVERMLSDAPIDPGDLVVLPEMFDSGFSLNTERTADSQNHTLQFIARLAEDLGVTIQAGRTVQACHCDKADNRASVVSPEGRLVCEYTKIHPFSYGREPEAIRPGTRVETYRWGERPDAPVVCPAVCYDLRFPELFRVGLTMGAEVFALGANWPDARQAHWRALAIARAIENQAFVLAVNRTGADPHLNYIGGTIALGPMGEVLGEMGDEEGVLSVEIDIARVRDWRARFPAWRDLRLIAPPHPGRTARARSHIPSHAVDSRPMIDLKQLRDDPDRFRDGARKKGVRVDVDRILTLDAERRALQTEQEALRAEQKSIEKSIGPQLGQLMGRLKKAEGDEKAGLEAEAAELRNKPAALKDRIQALDAKLSEVAPELESLLLTVPLPPDPDVPVGETSDDNVEIKRWAPQGWDFQRSFEANRGFAPRSHIELIESLGLCDFERGVKLAGARSYVLTGDGMRLHQAILRYAFDFIQSKGFRPTSVPVVVREEAMTGTGFFPGGRDQSYHIEETARGAGHDLYLTGTGEVGLMGIHQGEILDESDLPLKYATVSTCFRREAGAAGKDTAGLYRIHQFDKVEQVIICKADEAESRAHHRAMIEIVEELLQSLALPYRLIQCCTGDLGVKNADMVDIESWMPGRGAEGPDGRPLGAFGETHSASRLYDFQCRRLNLRYRPGGEGGKGATTFCHSLNNTVAASPRILIPLLEMHQQADGTIVIPEPLRPHMGGASTIG